MRPEASTLIKSATYFQDQSAAPRLALSIGYCAFLINLFLLLYLRRGLDFPPLLIGLSFLIVSAHYLGTVALGVMLSHRLWRGLAWTTYFWATGLAVILLRDMSVILVGSLAALCVASIAILWRQLNKAIFSKEPGLLTALVILALGLAALAGYQYYEEQTHFLMPEFLDLGILHKDPMTFIAFVATIMNGTQPGGVIDGLQPFPYHFGTMYFVASLATAAKSSPVMGQAAAHQLIFIPLIFFHLTQAVANIRPTLERANFAVPIAIALMFVLPGARWPVAFYSESSAATIPALFLFLSFVHAWQASDTLQRARWASLLLLLPLLVVCLSVKIPTGFMLFAFAGYLAVTLFTGQRTQVAIGLYLLGCAAVMLIALVLISRTASLASLLAMSNLPAVLIEAGIAGFIIAALVLLRRLHIIRSQEGRQVLIDEVDRRFLLWFAGAVAGGAVIAAVNFPYNARYLFNTLSIAAIPALSLALAPLFGRLEALASRRSVAAWIGPVVLILGFFALMEQTRLQPTAAAGRVDDANELVCVAVDRVCPQDRRLLPGTLPSEIPALIRASSGQQLITQAGRLVDRGAEAFFVPHDAEPVWRFLLSGHRPSDNLQFLPAHFGRPMVLGLPPLRYDLDLSIINASLPGTYDDSARSRPLSDEALCRHAAKLDIRVIAVIAGLAPTRGNRVLECAP